jgi:type IV secretory pathway VirJ component
MISPLLLWCLRSFLLIVLLVALGCSRKTLPEGSKAPAMISLKLARGSFSVRQYEPPSKPKALIVFGSGDGGWKLWEERTSLTLALAGFRVMGWDCKVYAAKPYDAEILGRDLQKISQAGVGSDSPKIPIFYAGYSTGAEQAIAAAAWSMTQGKSTHSSLLTPQALLLIAPGERSRYGITLTDLMGFSPRGKGSFTMSDMASLLQSLPVAQIHGAFDSLDSTEWLRQLKGHHRLYTIKDVGHFFGDADEDFLMIVVEAARWLLHQHSQIP